MRTRAGTLLLVVLLALAGCQVGYQVPSSPAEPSETPADPTPTPVPVVSPPDPATDRLGWEDGYWYNETLSITRSDGLNASERRALVGRAMARVERVRRLEFEERVPVRVVTREQYRDRFAGGARNYSEAFRAFDNAKFEAMFLIGEDTNSLGTQSENRGSNVLGFYSPRNDSIVLVSGATPNVSSELTLAHELVHALQDQHYNLSDYRRPTRERYNAFNGLVEGDASLVEERYGERCGTEWRCLTAAGGRGGGGGNASFHLGVYILNYFPYSDGPGFVRYHYRTGGWDAVNAMYEDPPASTEQVIRPPLYERDSPESVALADRSTADWERVRPNPPNRTRAPYAELGQSGMSTMFAYTLYDDENRSSVVSPRAFLNVDGTSVNRTDPFDYNLTATAGWAGDKMYVYWQDGSVEETAYVWKSTWDSAVDAGEFATYYRRLLAHYGGERVGESTWRIPDGPYADAFRVSVEDDTVVVVNAPTRSALDEVR